MSTTPNTPSEDPAPRGYFNQGQLEDLDLADSVFAAADALWPASNEANRPIRKTFSIPLNRAMGL